MRRRGCLSQTASNQSPAQPCPPYVEISADVVASSVLDVSVVLPSADGNGPSGIGNGSGVNGTGPGRIRPPISSTPKCGRRTFLRRRLRSRREKKSKIAIAVPPIGREPPGTHPQRVASMQVASGDRRCASPWPHKASLPPGAVPSGTPPGLGRTTVSTRAVCRPPHARGRKT